MVFILLGVLGIVMPGFIGMHLSMAHNLVHLITGALALWVGYSEDPGKSYTFSIAFGAIYGVLGLAGFLIGQPGYPGVGHMAADQNLLRVIPNVLEFGTMDHGIHILLSAFFLVGAFAWKHSFADADRSIIDVQSRRDTVDTKVDLSVRGPANNLFTTNTTGSNVGTDLHRSELGRNDVDRGIDQNRRDDFESRI
jgi:hypothetical protein